MADERHIHMSKAQAEQTISRIGAKIADANDLTAEIEKLSRNASHKLADAQEELSDLYENWDEKN